MFPHLDFEALEDWCLGFVMLSNVETADEVFPFLFYLNVTSLHFVFPYAWFKTTAEGRYLIN